MLNLPLGTVIKSLIFVSVAIFAVFANRPIRRRSIQQQGYGPMKPPPMMQGYGPKPQPMPHYGYQKEQPVVVQYMMPHGGNMGGMGGGGGGNAQDCFPADSIVYTRTGTVRMADLLNSTNAEVLVVDESNNVFYTPILMWLHTSEGEAQYVEVTSESGEKITASRTHFLFRVPCSGGRKEPIFAEEMQEGDCVLVLKGENVVPERVVKVAIGNNEGRYQFTTKTGTIIVDNIVASTYSVIDDHRFQHHIFYGYYYIHKFLEKIAPYLANQVNTDKKNYIADKMFNLFDSGLVV